MRQTRNRDAHALCQRGWRALRGRRVPTRVRARCCCVLLLRACDEGADAECGAGEGKGRLERGCARKHALPERERIAAHVMQLLQRGHLHQRDVQRCARGALRAREVLRRRRRARAMRACGARALQQRARRGARRACAREEACAGGARGTKPRQAPRRRAAKGGGACGVLAAARRGASARPTDGERARRRLRNMHAAPPRARVAPYRAARRRSSCWHTRVRALRGRSARRRRAIKRRCDAPVDVNAAASTSDAMAAGACGCARQRDFSVTS